MTFPPTFAWIAAALVSAAAPSLANAASLRLDGAIVHTVSGPSLTNASVLIRDGRIAAIGSSAAGAAADQVVDLKGLHLFPGLIAAAASMAWAAPASPAYLRRSLAPAAPAVHFAESLRQAALRGLACALLAPGARAARPFEDSMAQRTLPCTVCHGPQGRAAADGYYPRIAGKPAGYLFDQLLAFRDGRRRYGLMAHLLEPDRKSVV